MHTPLRLASLASTLLALAACGDDATNPTTTSGGTSSASLTEVAPTTGGTSTPTTGATSDPSTGVTTSGMTGDATSDPTTGDATTSTTSTTTGPATATTGTGETTMGIGTETSGGCFCAPGELGGCEDGQQLVCTEDCQGFAPEACPQGQTCKGETCSPGLCTPGAIECATETSTQTCNANGDAFEPPVDCKPGEGCSGGECLSLCQQAELEPSSIGCSFIASRVDNLFGGEIDSLVLGNTSKTLTAQVQLYFTPNGTNVEQAQGAPVGIQPGMTKIFQMTNPPFDKVSGLRKGGNYRVQSTIPIIAYQHSPITGQATNDASLLLPEHALRKDYVISSWPDSHKSYPSYFNVIALADGTTLQWTPSQATIAGAGVPAVAAGATGQVTMNRFDTLQVRANFGGDLSGTFVFADKPLWVLGAAECINVPTNAVGYCDHIQEQMLALDYWGKTYVGAHSPTRGTEKHYWRVYGGEDGTTVSTDPVQPGTPFTVDKAKFKDLIVPTNTSFTFTGDKPFMPVQYLESQEGGGETGDPAMYQMIPVEQFLDRYAFVTGQGYDVHYAQIIRTKGGPDVKVDGAVVGGYYAVGAYEVADYSISEGAHLAESDAPFGIISTGYTSATSYAYPGGLRLQIINPQ